MTTSTFHPVLEALGWALLHFLWQGAGLAVVLFAFCSLARNAKVTARYAAACGALLLMLGCFAGTLIHELPSVIPVIPNRLTAQVPLTAAKQTASAVTPLLPVPAPGTELPDWIAYAWLAGVSALSISTTNGWKRAQRLKVCGLERIDSISLEDLKQRLGITRAVHLYSSAMAEVPVVIGWMRPYILLPITALTGLTEGQIKAIVAHELAHIRRHDYLVNLFQTAVETLLFYHPAVWWVSKQIRVERENCCDDIAAAVCGDAVEYASALASMEEIRGQVPQLAVAANGGDLLGRIRRLLGEPETASCSVGRLAAVAIAVMIAGVPILLSQEAKPKFEVTSVKPNNSGDPDQYFRMGGVSPSMTNQTLKNVIQYAYGIHDFQLSGGPAWIGSDRYDMQGKTTADASLDQKRLMLQSLLEDRFKLAVHREIKELPIYELNVAKTGLKLAPIKDGSCLPFDPRNPGAAPGKTYMDYCGSGGIGRGMMEASSATMAELARALSNVVGRTVADKTGVAGQFRYHLTFAPEGTSTTDIGGPPPPPSDAPSIFTALQEQFGLKLDSAKGPVEVLVIDHAEKPSEN